MIPECGQGLSTKSQCRNWELHNLLYYIIYKKLELKLIILFYHHDICKVDEQEHMYVSLSYVLIT